MIEKLPFLSHAFRLFNDPISSPIIAVTRGQKIPLVDKRSSSRTKDPPRGQKIRLADNNNLLAEKNFLTNSLVPPEMVDNPRRTRGTSLCKNLRPPKRAPMVRLTTTSRSENNHNH